VKSEVEDRLREPKIEPKVRDYLTKLREEAFLQIKDGYIDSGAAPGRTLRGRTWRKLKPRPPPRKKCSRIQIHKKLFGLVPIPTTRAAGPVRKWRTRR